MLSAAQLPRNQFGLILMGNARVAPLQLADGLRCIGGSLFRFTPHATGTGGTIDEGPGIVAQSILFAAAGHILAGSTWHFQCWTRDPFGPCSLGSNLSNALSVTFVP